MKANELDKKFDEGKSILTYQKQNGRTRNKKGLMSIFLFG